MAAEEMIRRVWEEDQSGVRPTFFTAFLNVLSLPYRLAVASRNRLYDKGVFRQERLPCPVIGVGNLTVGGTGKTPTVILLANALRGRGLRPAVLSRGYGGNARTPVNIVSDGYRILVDWRQAGDEPLLIARMTPGVPVLTGARRSLTGAAALERFGADCLVLDDAFQHRALHRDIDILLVDATRPFGNGFLLPRGPLREAPESIRRAHVVILTGADRQVPEPPLIKTLSVPRFRGTHRPQALVEGDTGRLRSLTELRGQRLCAFAGIGRPEAFRQTLAELGTQVTAFKAYPDHHPYSRSDLDRLLLLAGQSGTDRLLTTEKDGVRLAAFPDFLPKVLFLRTGMEIQPAGTFTELIFSRLAY